MTGNTSLQCKSETDFVLSWVCVTCTPGVCDYREKWLILRDCTTHSPQTLQTQFHAVNLETCCIISPLLSPIAHFIPLSIKHQAAHQMTLWGLMMHCLMKVSKLMASYSQTAVVFIHTESKGVSLYWWIKLHQLVELHYKVNNIMFHSFWQRWWYSF